MPDEAGRWTAEHTVMDKNLEIQELKHLLEVKDNKIKKLEEEIEKLKGPDPYEDVSYSAGEDDDIEFQFKHPDLCKM